jgi:hypothetical protein
MVAALKPNDHMNQRASNGDSLPRDLEYLRAPALAFVDEERQIVGCGQVDFGVLERVLGEQTRGLSAKEAKAVRERQRTLLRKWLAENESSDERLVIGLRFVAMLLESQT